MPVALKVCDESLTGKTLVEIQIEVDAWRTTVREIIRSRVHQEVKDYNRTLPEYFRGLVQPTNTERTLNGYRIVRRRTVDWEEQFQRAVEAYAGNGFLVLVDDRQALDLDEEITLTPESRVSFVKLVPLVGG